MGFKKNKYKVVRNAISTDMANFIYGYCHIKQRVVQKLFDTKYIPPFEEMLGHWNDPQIPHTYVCYADLVMETLLEKVRPLMEKETGLILYPTYSYYRMYKTGDILSRHKDRFSCEISSTMFIGGDMWDIFLEPSGKVNRKGTKVKLKPGDLLIYRGCELEHWREPFQGKWCCQVFLHYNDASSKNAEQNKYDTREFVGLPSWFKKRFI